MRDSSRSRGPQRNAMKIRHRNLFVEWTQGDRVALLVGELTNPPKEFLVPLEFLRRRSREFRRLIPIHLEYTQHIKLAETRISTFEDFLIWTYTPQPQIDVSATFEETVHLGIFAWNYQIPSLSNQVTDLIRARLAEKEWPLEASIVDEVYGATPSTCPLRAAVRAALGQLPEGEVLKDEWKATFLKHAELGWDYIQAAASEWTKRDYLTDFCRFHDHQDISHRDSFAYCDGCPFVLEDCYPDEPQEEEVLAMKEDEVDHVIRSSNTALEDEAATGEDTLAWEGSSDRTTVRKTAEPVEVSPPDQSADSLVNGTSEEPASESTDNGAETAIEIDVGNTDRLQEVTEDDPDGMMESASVAAVDGTTVTSEGPGDELCSLKENESVIEEAEERLDEKLEEAQEEKVDDSKIRDTKGSETVAGKTVPDSKPKKKNKPKKRSGGKA